MLFRRKARRRVLAHGFVRTPEDKIRSFDVSGASDTYGQSRDKGAITGYYDDKTGYHGFVRVPQAR